MHELYCGGFGSAMVKDVNVTPTSNVRSITTERPSVYISLEPYNRQRYDDFISITGRKRDIGVRMGIPVRLIRSLLHIHQMAILTTTPQIQDNDEMDYTNAPYVLLSYLCLPSLISYIQVPQPRVWVRCSKRGRTCSETDA